MSQKKKKNTNKVMQFSFINKEKKEKRKKRLIKNKMRIENSKE